MRACWCRLNNIEVSPEGYVYELRLDRYIPSSGEDVGVPHCTGCIYLRICILYVYEYERETYAHIPKIFGEKASGALLTLSRWVSMGIRLLLPPWNRRFSFVYYFW